MKVLFFVCLCACISACKKNPHTSKGEIETLIGAKADKIITQKKYQLDDSASFEDISIIEIAGKSELVIATPAEKGYKLLRRFSWPTILTEPKIFFISTGNKTSHILLTHGAAKKTLELIDAQNFSQVFSPESFDTGSVKTVKNDEKPQDEFLVLGTTNYRFNGMQWIPFVGDEIFPYVDKFEVAGETSLIEIVNRGQFGTRVIVTLALLEADAATFQQKVKLTKDIPTVHLYRPGRLVHKNGGGDVGLAHTLIEIHKDAWPKNGRIKLPLYLNNVSKYTLRAAYSQRGHTQFWPSAAAPGIVKDGQDYFAVERK